MKTRLLALTVLLTANLILLFLEAAVNHSSLLQTPNGAVLVADGNPGPGLPPPPPPPNN
jgi:hypothetical protein